MSAGVEVTATCIGLVIMSCQVFAPVSRRVTQTLTSLPTLPIQVNLVASNLATPLLPSRGSVGILRLKTPITVPSRGEALNTWFAAARLPAPGRLTGMTVGFPGMYLPICRATARITVS